MRVSSDQKSIAQKKKYFTYKGGARINENVEEKSGLSGKELGNHREL